MASRSAGKVVGRLTAREYALLRSLTDRETLDAATLEASVAAVVRDRLELAKGFMEAAKVLAGHANPLVRRSAVSRAYYGAYHAARAAVFAIQRRDEDDHEKLPRAIDAVLEGLAALGDDLKGLRRLRNEMDYSPYPGPNEQSQYDDAEGEAEIVRSIDQAERLVLTLERHLAERR